MPQGYPSQPGGPKGPADIHESEIGGKDALAEPNRELKSVSVSFRVRVVRASERARRSCTLCGRCGRGVFVNAGQ